MKLSYYGHRFSVLSFIKDDDKILKDIYIPDGYNNIEKTLTELIPKNDEQIIFGIPGCDKIVSKRIIWNNLEEKYGREVSKNIMPETFVLSNNEHMELFKNTYQEDKIYIMKKVNQRKMGLYLTKDYESILNGKENNFLVVQDYIKDVLLINKRKLNLRIYFLLTIKDNKIEAYLSRYGSCIYNNKDYDPDSMDFESNITSYNLDLDIYKTNPQTFSQLKTYLKDAGYDNPEKIFDKIKDKMICLCESIENKIGSDKLKKNLCAQIFGCDFIVDKNLNPYLLECNKGPDMSPKIYGDYEELLKNIEKFYAEEEKMEKSYSKEYVSGSGLKVEKDMLELLGILSTTEVDIKNGFYKIY